MCNAAIGAKADKIRDGVFSVLPLHHLALWGQRADSNRRPIGYEPIELTNCSTLLYGRKGRNRTSGSLLA